ncbi:MAG: hypothetical protein LBV45_01350, partial [Xanthomonadaceae bacterium]|nr:hypothetical protein [Xanthomonadaceae bacterium]
PSHNRRDSDSGKVFIPASIADIPAIGRCGIGIGLSSRRHAWWNAAPLAIGTLSKSAAYGMTAVRDSRFIDRFRQYRLRVGHDG